MGLVWFVGFVFFSHLDNKISCFLFLFRVFIQTVVQPTRLPPGSRMSVHPLPVLSENPSQHVSPRDLGRFHTPPLQHNAHSGSHTLRCSFALYSPSLIVVILVLLAVGQGRAGPDLAVAVEPLLHHLGDQRVVAAAGALLHGHQDPSLCHAAVQPLPQQLLLLLLVAYLWGTQNTGNEASQRPGAIPAPSAVCWILLIWPVLGITPTGSKRKTDAHCIFNQRLKALEILSSSSPSFFHLYLHYGLQLFLGNYFSTVGTICKEGSPKRRISACTNTFLGT